MLRFLKLFGISVFIVSVGMNIALLTNTTNYDKTILTIAERSHFVGCARVSLNFPYCEILSKQYRDDVKKNNSLVEE